jgi:protein SCO1/2
LIDDVEYTEKEKEREKFKDFGGDWVLKDLNGKPFGSKNLTNTYYIMYFGFSNCPDVCPISLMKMTNAIRKLKRTREGQQYI